MKMYTGRDVIYIVEEFMARHFNFDSVSLNRSSIVELKLICENYGIEVENISEN